MSVIRDRIALLAEQYLGTVGVFRGGLSRQQLKDAGSDDDKDIYQVDKLRGADLVIRMVKEMNP